MQLLTLNVNFKRVNETCKCGRSVYAYKLVVHGPEGVSDESSEARCADCLAGGGQQLFVLEPPKAGKAPPSAKVKRRTRRQEQEGAKLIGGRLMPASGAMPTAKGDYRKRGRWRVDEKSTETATYKLTLAQLTKSRGECIGAEKFALPIQFVDKTTQQVVEHVVVVPYEWWTDKCAQED